MNKRGDRLVILKRLACVAGIGLASAAFAAGPWISVPSTANAQRKMVVSGGDLGANAVVTLRVEDPTGAVQEQKVTASSTGTIRVEFPLSAQGGYRVKAYDAKGLPIGGGILGFNQ